VRYLERRVHAPARSPAHSARGAELAELARGRSGLWISYLKELVLVFGADVVGRDDFRPPESFRAWSRRRRHRQLLRLHHRAAV